MVIPEGRRRGGVGRRGASRQDEWSRAAGVFFVVEPNRAQLSELGRRLAARELRPVVGAVMPLAQGAAAFAAKRRGSSPGKIVLQVAADPP